MANCQDVNGRENSQAKQSGKGLMRDVNSISCLMTTRNRLPLVKRAIRCFQSQTHVGRELVIVDDGVDATQRFVSALGDARITHIRPERDGMTLGELRNLAVASATGEYVMQWDDDDWHHPDRIKIQMAALKYTYADACFLSRWTLAWPARGLFLRSKERLWEGSMLVRKSILPEYPAMRVGEDAAVVEALLEKGAVICRVDHPELYVYVAHGGNTFTEEHFSRNIFDEHTGRLNEREVAEIMRNLALEHEPA